MPDDYDFFQSVTSFFQNISDSVSASIDGAFATRNRAQNEASRWSNAQRTGIVTERDGKLQKVPEYVYTLGANARVIDCGLNPDLKHIEDRFQTFSRLKALKLDGCSIAGTLPRSLMSARLLKVLNVRGNKLTTLPDAIGELKMLEDLDVCENALTTLPESLGMCAKLRIVRASRNALETGTREPGPSWLDALGNCLELEVIVLSENPRLNGELPMSWGCLLKLKEIDVDGTSVSGVPREIFIACASLQTLSMRGCPIDVAALKRTDGYDTYETKRQLKHDKQLSSRVLLNASRLDERLR